MILLVIAGYVLLIFYESKSLYKKKMWKDFWMNIILGSFSFTVAILISLDIKIPSPVTPIRDFIISIFGE